MKQIFFLIAIVLFGGYLMAQELKPAVGEALLKGIYIDPQNNQPLPGGVIAIEDIASKKRNTFTTNEEGRFSTILKQGKSYKVYINFMDKTAPMDGELKIPALKNSPLTLDYTVYKPQVKITYLRSYLLNIHFETGKAILFEESYITLDAFADTLKAFPKMVVEIAGHTDNVGDDKSNEKLSQERANVVQHYIIIKGINSSRISAKGYGEHNPIATNNTEEGRATNRRTEVRVINE